MTSKFVENVPLVHCQGSSIHFAANRWPDFSERPPFGRPFAQIFRRKVNLRRHVDELRRMGYRDRAWQTRAGAIDMRIPKLRKGGHELTFKPDL